MIGNESARNLRRSAVRQGRGVGDRLRGVLRHDLLHDHVPAVLVAVTHRPVDFAIAYKRVGLPVGLVVGTAALLYLGIQWSRRMARRGRAS